MKFTTYNQQVAPASNGVAKLQVSSDPNAYGGNGAGLTAMAKGVQQLAAGIEAHNENEDKMTYTEAMNELDKRRNALLYDGDNAYTKRILKDAQGSSQAYEADMKKATEEVAKQFGFKTPAYKMAFLNSAQRSNMEGYKMVNKREYEQTEAYKNVLDEERLGNKIKGVVNGAYRSPSYIQNALEDERLSIDRRFPNESKEVRDLRMKEVTSKLVGASINQAIVDKDFKTAKDYLESYREEITPDAFAKYTKQISSQESVALTQDYAKNMADSNMTMAQAIEHVKTLTKGVDYIERDVPMQDIEDKGLAGTNKNLVSATKMLDGWVYQTFGKDFQVSGGKRSKQHNKEVNGSSNSYHLVGGAIDVNLSMFDAEQRQQIINKAKEMGFNSDGEDMYHDKGTGEHLHLTLPGGVVQGGRRPLSRDEQEEVLAEFKKLKARNEYIENEQVKLASENWDMQYRSLKDDPQGREKGQAILRANAGLPPKQYHALEAVIKHYTGGSGSNGTGSAGSYGKAPHKVEVAAIIDRLKQGGFKDREQPYNTVTERNNFNEYVNTKYGNNPAAKLEMDKLFQDYSTGKGSFSYDDKDLINHVLAGSHLKPVEKSMAERNIKAYAATWIAANTTPDGVPPSFAQVVEACRKARGETLTFKYTPENAIIDGIDEKITIDKTEQLEVKQSEDGHFDVTVLDAWGQPKTYHMTGEELHAYRGTGK